MSREVRLTVVARVDEENRFDCATNHCPYLRWYEEKCALFNARIFHYDALRYRRAHACLAADVSMPLVQIRVPLR